MISKTDLDLALHDYAGCLFVTKGAKLRVSVMPYHNFSRAKT